MKNQNNNNYTNIYTVNQEKCQNKFKHIYHIDNNLSFIIFKVDYYMAGLLILIIGYKVYHPINKPN